MHRHQPRPAAERRPPRIARAALGVVAVLALSVVATPPSGAAVGHAPGRVVRVVAAENMWGSIAAQIGGAHVRVTSIITNPNTDPHSYEPTPRDARTIAEAALVIENGIGYDAWAAKAVAADQGHPTVLNVGDVVGAQEGDNPHRWYNPADVQTVINRLVVDYQHLDPADSAYFEQQRATFNTVALARYNALIGAIKTSYQGVPVGASESIFAMLSPSLGLDLITPPSFLRAISEGTDVTAADKATIDQQIQSHQIKVYVYNRQNVTPDVKAQLALVKQAKIPVASITETLLPPTATYQAWQVRQLQGLQAALATALGR
jgi:zinc/manganese transport system substrate-binding protein